MKPLYALHKDCAGKVLGATSFTDDYALGVWVKALDLRDGDAITFGETAVRPEFDEVEPERTPLTPPHPQPALADAGDDQPF